MNRKFKLYKGARIVYFGDMDEEPHKVVLEDREAPTPVNPVVWLGVLAVPLVLGLLVGFGKTGAEEPVEKPVIERKNTGILGRSAAIATDNPVIAPAVQKPAVAAKTYKCDFAPWVGLKVENEMLTAIKGAGRPYRLVPPGSAVTQDYRPERINFDLNDAGKITRIWCG